MSYTATVIKVFIASPGDVQKERDLIRETIYKWNTVNSFSRGIVLMPVGWETDSVASYGAPPQEEINKKLLESCDLLIGVFWSKLGTPTDHYQSGTVEEIELHDSQGKQTMLFFSTAAIPQDRLDAEQIANLKEFKEAISAKCLYKEYDGSEKFKDLFDFQLNAKLLEDWVLIKYSPTTIAENPENEIVKINITRWSDLLELPSMYDWISGLTTVSPKISVQKYEHLEKLTQWILSRNWEPVHNLYSDSFYKFRLILRDLLDIIMSSSDVTNTKIYCIERRYRKFEGDYQKEHMLVKDFNFREALIQDLAIELSRAANFILDLYRREIDPLFQIDIGRVYITTGMHWDQKLHFHVVRYNDDEKSIPYNNLEQFKVDRKNRDISMGRGKDITDPEFIEWNNR